MGGTQNSLLDPYFPRLPSVGSRDRRCERLPEARRAI